MRQEMGNSPQSRELVSGPRQLLVNLHSEPVVHSLVLGHLQWSCWHQVGRGRDVPEASLMQNAAPTAKCPQALNGGGGESLRLGGTEGGSSSSRPHSQHSPSQVCNPLLACNACFKANPSSA